MKIALAGDHAAFSFKKDLKNRLQQEHEVNDYGTNTEESCDYPDFAFTAIEALKKKEVERVILICNNGIGMSIFANRFKHVFAALVYNELTAKMTREHHDSNVLCLGAKQFEKQQLFNFVNIWLNTNFLGERHQRRRQKINQLS